MFDLLHLFGDWLGAVASIKLWVAVVGVVLIVAAWWVPHPAGQFSMVATGIVILATAIYWISRTGLSD